MILAKRNHSVSGSDPQDNTSVQQLRDQGIRVFSKQSTATIRTLADEDGKPPIVVVSTAIPESNPELREARRSGLEIWHRSDLLAALIALQPSIAVAGSHGKRQPAP